MVKNKISKKALRKDFYMEIKGSLGRFLSLFFIVAIGVAFFSGIRSAEPDMRYSADQYFDENNLMDIKVVSTLGLTKGDAQALKEVKGVERVEVGYSMDALCALDDSQKVVHIFSILPTMNKLRVSEGRLPQSEDECFVDQDFLQSGGYQVGDEVTFSSGTDEDILDTLKTNTYKIVGAGSSPCYISFQRGSSTIGTGTVSGFVAVSESAFDMDVYTEIYASVQGAKELTAFTKDYEGQVETVMDRIEEIKIKRQEVRYNDIVEEANEELEDAKQELADAKQEAEEKLGDAKTKLDDGQRQLADGKAELEKARETLQNSERELNDQQAALDQKREELNAGIEELNTKIAELNAVKEQYTALAESGMADRAALEMMYAQIMEGDSQIAAAGAQMEEAKAQLASGQEQINGGWEQFNQGIDEFNSAQEEIAENEQKLLDAQTEYNDAKTEAEEKIADGEAKIKDAEDEISKIEHATWYIYDRDTLPDYTGYGENADRMRAIGRVFPALFFLVAALISLTTMTRMVEEQRTQIGTIKALGYKRHSIAGKYLGYALLATISGSLFGVLTGEKILPYIIIYAYGIMYQHMETIVVPYNLFYAVYATSLAVVCSLGATVFSCYKEMRTQAAQLMRPPAPKKGKRVFLEKIPFLWKHLSFIWKATVRNLIRYKKRFFMTVFGIGGCMALLLVGFGLKDSIFDIAVLQYDKIQLYDAMVILNDDASQEEKDEVYDVIAKDDKVDGATEVLTELVTIKKGGEEKEVFLNVPSDLSEIGQFLVFEDRVTQETYELNDEGVILTEKMAKMLDAKRGDTIYIKDDIKGELEVVIEEICENYMSHYVYMTPALYEKIYEKEPKFNSIYFRQQNFNKAELEELGEHALTYEGALSISYTSEVEGQLDDMLGSLNIVLVVLVISAGMLAFVVLYNLNNINITERKRELATIKVLGFYDKEVSAYVYRENIVLTLIGCLAGVVLGKFLHQFVIVTVEIESAMFGRNIDISSFVYSCFITIGFSLFVNWVMYYKLKKIDMVESLKSVE